LKTVQVGNNQEGDCTVMSNTISPDNPLTGVRAPRQILRSALAALGAGKIAEVADQVDDPFQFADHALDLEFTDRGRLIEFFQKTRELFPDTALEVVASFECGDHAMAEWKLTATQTVPYGSTRYRFPILVHGSTVAQIQMKNGKIARWSDYYDRNASRRGKLAEIVRRADRILTVALSRSLAGVEQYPRRELPTAVANRTNKLDHASVLRVSAARMFAAHPAHDPNTSSSSCQNHGMAPVASMPTATGPSRAA
jgi:hypothetical protein